MNNILPFSRSYWVIPNKFLGNYTLASESKDKCFQKIQAVYNVGIRVVINLMTDGELNSQGSKVRQYDDWLTEFNSTVEEPLIYERYPFHDMTAPSKKLMKQILDSIDYHNSVGKAVSVACRGGAGRLGCVTGAFLKRHGMANNNNVFDFINYLRRTESSNLPSPQRQSQKEFILQWSINE